MKILDNSKWNSEIGNSTVVSTVVDSCKYIHELEFQDYDLEVLQLNILHRRDIAPTSIYKYEVSSQAKLWTKGLPGQKPRTPCL